MNLIEQPRDNITTVDYYATLLLLDLCSLLIINSDIPGMQPYGFWCENWKPCHIVLYAR